jgi:RHS repeat-associated protein
MRKVTRSLISRLGIAALLGLFISMEAPGQETAFRRGYVNSDLQLDVSDAIQTLGFLFLHDPASLDCKDAADTNDDGLLDISDAIYTLSFLFVVGPPPPPPFEHCGPDPTVDSLDCASSVPCRNRPPTAALTAAPTGGEAPLTVHFDASGSRDPEGLPLSFEWDFGDGEASKASPQGRTDHSYLLPGDFTATVTVRDDAGGTARASARLSVALSGLPADPGTVATPIDLTVATEFSGATAFLFEGVSPIQTGVVPGTIDSRRAAVLRGKVKDRRSTPIPGVRVTILGHPEYGQTLTRVDGMFDLAVNGGGPLTLDYARAGYCSAQRQIQVPWQDYAVLPEVVLVPLDTVKTVVDLGTSDPIKMARGSEAIDESGRRCPTLLFQRGTGAEMVRQDGSRVPLTSITVRATEFTVGPSGPEAMPADLPPASGYTYCVELSADEALGAGASEVRFSQPVALHLENFLGFPVGAAVPTGFYDRTSGVWVPSDSGRVVRVLSITAGAADLDLDGDGIADGANALAALGVTTAELESLGSLYFSGQSLWRVPIEHFSAWDCNWGIWPEGDAKAPDVRDPRCDNLKKDPKLICGSIIEAQNQILGETAPVTGTPFTLNYRSDRVPGRNAAYSLEIQVSGETVPNSVSRMVCQVHIAGRIMGQSFPRELNKIHHFIWDGKDAYGRTLQGKQAVLARVGYAYRPVYQQVARFGYSGNGLIIEASPSRDEFILWKDWRGRIGTWNAQAEGLGGWSIDVHHAYDPADRVLYLGDGGRRRAEPLNNTISTVAGNGNTPFPGVHCTGASCGDGGPATAVVMLPVSVAVGPDGSLFIVDPANVRIRRVVRDGTITTVAGGGSGEDGGPADQARLLNPQGVAVAPDGTLYIADVQDQRVRCVARDGIITTIAGITGIPGFAVEGPAVQAKLSYPFGVAATADGSLYIADGTSQVYRVDTDGQLTRVAGDRSAVSSGDGGPAILAQIFPSGIAVGKDGSLYIVEGDAHRVRRVRPDGIITTVAGSGFQGPIHDGILATQASLSRPGGIHLLQDGSLLVADTGNSSIREVGLDGIINTVAGTGVADFTGDGGSATQATLYDPRSIAVSPDGSLFIADTFNHRIRRVAPPLPGVSATDFVIAAEDGSEAFVFDKDGRHLRTHDTLTEAIRYQFSYDTTGRLSNVFDGDGNETRIEHDGSGNPSGITGPYGQRTTLTIDVNGYLATIVNPAGEEIQLGHAPDGLLATRKDPRGNAHAFTYDAQGRLELDEDPADGFKRIVRTEEGNAYTVTVTTKLAQTTKYRVEELPDKSRKLINTGANGLDTQIVVSPDGSSALRSPDGMSARVVRGPDPRWSMEAPITKSAAVTTPAGLTFQTASRSTATLLDASNPFSLNGLLDITEVNGRPYMSEYEAATRTFTETTPEGRESTTLIDRLGRPLDVEVPGLFPARFAYDDRGRLKALGSGGGDEERKVFLTYDTSGRLETVTDPLARVVSFSYDQAGRLTSQTLPGNRVVGFSYDKSGNLLSLTPPGRPPHTFTYSRVDQVEEYSPPDVVIGPDQTTYTYNFDRQLTHIARPDGQDLEFSYVEGGSCSCGRLSSITFARGVTKYRYDPATGNLLSIEAPGGSTLTYEQDGSLTTREIWSGSGAVAGSVSRTYDNDFRVASISVNGTEKISYAYDGDGLLVGAGALTLRRDPQNGLLSGTTLGSVMDSFTYNGFGEPESYSAAFGGASLYSVIYTRDKLGHITLKTETVGGVTTSHGYIYDLAGRLHQVLRNGVLVATYTYDANGNRLTYTGPGGTITGTYDNQDRLLAYGDTTYTYTANGELWTKTTAGQTTTYDYDALGNLMAVSLPDGTRLEYLVDGRNRRIGKKVNGVLVQGFVYQDQLEPIAELDGNGSVVSRFLYGTRGHAPDYMIKAGVVFRYVLDQLGSPRLVVNTATGQVAQTMDYDAFGNVAADSNAGFQPFAYAGGMYDRYTTIVRFGARDYDAVTARWMSKDPRLFESSQTTFYAYVENDPVDFMDPSGLFPLSPCAKDKLGPFFPGLNLDNLDIQLGIPWWAIGKPAGFTVGNTVYVDPAQYNESTASGLGLIGHELQHVQQFQSNGGIPGFGAKYIGEYLGKRLEGKNHRDAYRDISYEREAFTTQREIKDRLNWMFGPSKVCGCK